MIKGASPLSRLVPRIRYKNLGSVWCFECGKIIFQLNRTSSSQFKSSVLFRFDSPELTTTQHFPIPEAAFGTPTELPAASNKFETSCRGLSITIRLLTKSSQPNTGRISGLTFHVR